VSEPVREPGASGLVVVQEPGPPELFVIYLHGRRVAEFESLPDALEHVRRDWNGGEPIETP
jgi:hypothetical protein